MAVARMNGRDADLGWLAPGHIATISHLILRKRQNEVPEKKLNDDSRRQYENRAISVTTRTSGANQEAERPARLEQSSTGCKYIFGENGTLELRNSARIVQSLDSWLVLLTR